MKKDFIDELQGILKNTENNDIKRLYNDMSKYQKNIFDKMLEDTATLENYSLNDLLYDFDKDFIEKLLQLEINIFLKMSNTCDNKRNGYTSDIDLTIGERKIEFNRPRLRKEKDFDSILIPKRTRIIKDLDKNIILLYSKNNSMNDIIEILKQMFNISISNAYVSQVVQSIATDVLQWRNRNLDACYFTMNIDCTYITLRDQKNLVSHKIPIYVVIGTKLNGHKEILGIYLGNEDEDKNIIDKLYNQNIGESKNFWLTVFDDLKDRGVEKILYAISDGIGGIQDAIKDIFPSCFHQRCTVHLIKNLKKYTTKKNCKEILKDFKSIYNAPNKDIAYENINAFKEKYKSKKTMLKHALDYIDLILPLFDTPVNIRKYIYTNNISESANSKIKRGFYGRGALPNVSSAINIIFFNLKDLEDKWSKHKVPNWDKIYNEIIQVHYNDIKVYLNGGPI